MRERERGRERPRRRRIGTRSIKNREKQCRDLVEAVRGDRNQTVVVDGVITLDKLSTSILLETFPTPHPGHEPAQLTLSEGAHRLTLGST